MNTQQECATVRNGPQDEDAVIAQARGLLVSVRGLHRVTDAEAALALGVSQSHIEEAVSGDREMPLSELFEYISAFGLAPSEGKVDHELA